MSFIYIGGMAEKLKPLYKLNRKNPLRLKRIAICVLLKMQNQESWLRESCRYYGIQPSTLLYAIKKYDLNEQYAIAKEALGYSLIESALQLADKDIVPDMDGRIDRGAVEHLKVRIDMRKWLTSKITKQFSDRKQVELEVKEITLADVLKQNSAQ